MQQPRCTTDPALSSARSRITPEQPAATGRLLNIACAPDCPDVTALPSSKRAIVDKEQFGGLTAFDTRRAVYGAERRAILTHSPELHEAQAAGFTGTTLAKAGKKLDDLAATLARGKTRRSRDKVEAEIAAVTAKPWVRRVIRWDLAGTQPKDLRLTWSADPEARAALEEEIFGKHVLITSHDDWPVPDVVAGYRSQSESEFSFRQMKDTLVVSFSPMHHWTEHSIRVHMFTCVLALQVAHLMRLRAARAGLRMSVRELLRELAGIGETVQAIAVLARAQQDAVWDRTTAHNKLRSHLREYYPGFLAAFADARGGIMRPEARTILAAAPTPADAATLTLTQLRALLRKAGRIRGIDAEATRLREAFRAPQMRQLPLVEAAMGRQSLALLGQLDAACTAADDLEHAAVESFNLHPDAGIITSFPGLGALTGARVLAEIGDDRSRFQDAKGLKAYAGAAPITRASGKTRSVTHRRIKNNRLNAAGYLWAFSALTASPGARAHYDRRKDAGDGHAAAQRNLFGRLLGCLHRCLTTGQHYDENIAFPATPEKLPKAA